MQNALKESVYVTLYIATKKRKSKEDNVSVFIIKTSVYFGYLFDTSSCFVYFSISLSSFYFYVFCLFCEKLAVAVSLAE